MKIDKQIYEALVGASINQLGTEQKAKLAWDFSTALGLDPTLNPISFISFRDKKEIPYLTRGATDSLRKIWGISLSVHSLEWSQSVYTVLCEARYYDTDVKRERVDFGTGVVNCHGLSGNAVANAMMRAETKSKRRATISILGLAGLIDEIELDTIDGYKKI